MDATTPMDDQDAAVLLRLAPPGAWKLVAELLVKGQYPIVRCRDAVAMDTMLGSLLTSEKFKQEASPKKD